ncbi:MAG: CoA transferase [Halobacteriales archaeon]
MTTPPAGDADDPLEGLRVLDLTTMISGGFSTVMFADFGADVISVEHPTYEDPVRGWAPRSDGESLYWKNLGRNKRHVTLDLSADGGQRLARELAADADLVFENFRPGTLERWGLDYETLSADNDDLILVRISGYGQTGPKSSKPGFGTVAESISTFAHINGFPDTSPLLPPIPLADLTAAMFAVQGAMFALYARDEQGGQVVDTSLYEPLFRLMVGDVEAYDLADRVPDRTGNISVQAAPRNLYPTEDGYIALSAASQNIFENVMAAIDREDLIDDPRFETNEDRIEHREQLDDIIEDWTADRTREEALAEMEATDAIVGPVYTMADAFEDEHYADREDIVAVEDDDLGEVRTHGVFPKLSETPGTVDHLGGNHGEHNEAVFLDELGLSREELQRLREEGVV